MRQIPNAEPECCFVLRPALPVPRRATTLGQPTSPRTTAAEGEISYEPFQPAVFLFDLPQPTECAHTPMRVLLFPGVEGGLTAPELPAEIANQGPTLRLPEGIDNLFFREP